MKSCHECDIIEHSEGVQEEYTFIHTCRFQHIVLKGISFSDSESPSGVFLCLCVHVWVCPRVCLGIVWPAESVMAELICYTAKRETVTGTSGHTVES